MSRQDEIAEKAVRKSTLKSLKKKKRSRLKKLKIDYENAVQQINMPFPDHLVHVQVHAHITVRRPGLRPQPGKRLAGGAQPAEGIPVNLGRYGFVIFFNDKFLCRFFRRPRIE